MGFFFARAIYGTREKLYTSEMGNRSIPPPDISYFSRRVFLPPYRPNPFCRGLSDDIASTSEWHLKVPTDDEWAWICAGPLSPTNARSLNLSLPRQSITGECWNQGKCRFGARGWRSRVTSRVKDDGCFPRRWWRFTSWRRQDQDRNFRTKEQRFWFSGAHNFVLVIN